MTVIPSDVLESAQKVVRARWEVIAGGQTAQCNGEMTEEDREWLANSIATENDPTTRKRLIREVLDSGLAAMQVGQELAREVMKAAGGCPAIAATADAPGQ
jgi:hypothetical protein